MRVGHILGSLLIASIQTALNLEQQNGAQLTIDRVGFMAAGLVFPILLQQDKGGALLMVVLELRMRMLNSSVENQNSGKPRIQINRFHIQGGDMNYSFKIFILWLCSICAYAGTCRLPIPDGGPPDYKVSHANLDGKLFAIDDKLLTIKDYKTGRLVKVSLPAEKALIYSAFGGDIDSSELKAGVYAWVWFKNCKKSDVGGITEISYLKIYSKNPQDQPSGKSVRLGRRS